MINCKLFAEFDQVLQDPVFSALFACTLLFQIENQMKIIMATSLKV